MNFPKFMLSVITICLASFIIGKLSLNETMGTSLAFWTLMTLKAIAIWYLIKIFEKSERIQDGTDS